MKKLLFATVAASLLGLTPALAEYQTEHRGGTMRLVARSAGGTVDPHINYTLQYWQVYQSLYDGLVGFKKAAGADGFTKVPNLAEAIPEPKFVRMGWRDIAIPNLKDKDAWPAFAFSSQPVTR